MHAINWLSLFFVLHVLFFLIKLKTIEKNIFFTNHQTQNQTITADAQIVEAGSENRNGKGQTASATIETLGQDCVTATYTIQTKCKPPPVEKLPNNIESNGRIVGNTNKLQTTTELAEKLIVTNVTTHSVSGGSTNKPSGGGRSIFDIENASSLSLAEKLRKEANKYNDITNSIVDTSILSSNSLEHNVAKGKSNANEQPVPSYENVGIVERRPSWRLKLDIGNKVRYLFSFTFLYV